MSSDEEEAATTAPSTAKRGASASGSKSSKPTPKAIKTEPAGGDDSGDDAGGADGAWFELGSRKRVEVARFKNIVLVRIGEWYEKDGELRPGKGISLKVEQWQALIDNKDKLTEAYNSQDATAVVNLSEMRRASISQFKNMWLYNIREYYKDDAGDLKPGRKGASLTNAQWQQLLGAAAAIDAAIEELTA